MQTTVSQKVGIAIASVGALSILGLGWLYSWWLVPAIGKTGFQNAPVPGLVRLFWGLSVPVGALIALIGAGMYARVGWRRLIVLTAALFLAVMLIAILSPSVLLPGLFGINGGLMALFFLGILLHWSKTRQMHSQSDHTVSDLRMAGYVFFLVASWYLCGLLGAPSFALRPELMQRYGTLAGATSLGSIVSISLVLGWLLTFLAHHVEARGRKKTQQAHEL